MLHIKQARYKISDNKVFVIDQLLITKGSSWAFIGRNGSGKSTLARALAGKQRLLSGEVVNQFQSIATISFEQLKKLVEDEWNRNNTDMILDSEEDIGFTASQIIQEKIKNNHRCEALAEQFGIVHLLAKRFKYLSTGETRKVLLCRLLMVQPDLLILDDPFDGLDVTSRENLSAHLAQLALQGITLILILNRFNEIPPWTQNMGLIIHCHLSKVGIKEALFNDTTIAQFVNMDNLKAIQLPDSDEPIKLLSDECAFVMLNNGYVQYHDKPIINGLTWQVKAKENWQIVGPNGAGKSTLLSLITGDHPQGYSNDLTLFGHKRGTGETIWDIKRHIGYVSSSLHLDYRVSINVRTVLLSGYFDSICVYQQASDQQHHLVNQWLKLLNLTAQADQSFQSLSWGQQRLVLIARALVKHPALLILDEPLQGLDQLNRELVKRWIDILMQEGHSQLLFVSHHAEDAPTCITHRLTFILKGDNSYRYQLEKI